jgi:hypothetical protein
MPYIIERQPERRKKEVKRANLEDHNRGMLRISS